ncbi:hypothetical protein [Aestuariibacter salexigens]|uniref:hypothetical protein n=1 Tax=Aestuariibacter salexigens TaxID=226010 RepID=UPI00047C2425|nr:hypothetical protein [Aestuariibacter salexigens]
MKGTKAKRRSYLRDIAVTALLLGSLSGCASTPQQDGLIAQTAINAAEHAERRQAKSSHQSEHIESDDLIAGFINSLLNLPTR